MVVLLIACIPEKSTTGIYKVMPHQPISVMCSTRYRDTHNGVPGATRSSSGTYSLCYRRIYLVDVKDITRDLHHNPLHNITHYYIPPLPTPSTEGPKVTSLPLTHYYIHLLREHSSSMERVHVVCVTPCCTT